MQKAKRVLFCFTLFCWLLVSFQGKKKRENMKQGKPDCMSTKKAPRRFASGLCMFCYGIVIPAASTFFWCSS